MHEVIVIDSSSEESKVESDDSSDNDLQSMLRTAQRKLAGQGECEARSDQLRGCVDKSQRQRAGLRVDRLQDLRLRRVREDFGQSRTTYADTAMKARVGNRLPNPYTPCPMQVLVSPTLILFLRVCS